ncbi:hypothetical protein ABH966_002008 [Lysinibacillus sp. RC46]
MGNIGSARNPTGIYLHIYTFEVKKKGLLENPLSYVGR